MAAREWTWFITGCSSGFGRQIAQAVLARGERVVLTARDPGQLAEIAAPHGERALALALDVNDEQMIAGAVAAAERHFGRIDVLVNNAGYGYFSAIEEGEDVEIRRQFETNVFGLFSLTRHVLPIMRRRRAGHVINFSSIGGFMGFPALGYYNASKFAVEGFSEALAQEVAPLGIRVTIVEPGRFRTQWAGRSVAVSANVIDDYAETAGKRSAATRAASGSQPGDPAKAAAAIVAIVDTQEPPLRLLLGTDAYNLALGRLDTLRENFTKWRDMSLGTDFDPA